MAETDFTQDYYESLIPTDSQFDRDHVEYIEQPEVPKSRQALTKQAIRLLAEDFLKQIETLKISSLTERERKASSMLYALLQAERCLRKLAEKDEESLSTTDALDIMSIVNRDRNIIKDRAFVVLFGELRHRKTHLR